MRELKFRAWDGCKMIEPYSVRNGKAFVIRPCDKSDKVLTDEKGTNYYCNWDVDVATDYPLMQFTGLHDANGVEIYEGDIVNIAQNGWATDEYRGVVVEYCGVRGYSPWDECSGQIDIDYLASAHSEDIEVVGNIHENPELVNA